VIADDETDDGNSEDLNNNDESHEANPIYSCSEKSTVVQLSATSDKSLNDSVELMYAGVFFDKDEDIVKFATTKCLNALLEYVKDTDRQADTNQVIHFNFQAALPSDYIELIFDDEHQDDQCDGWMIRPPQKPCKLYKKFIDDFGSITTPIPVSCAISVSINNDSPKIVPKLNYGIPLKGINPAVTVFIQRTLNSGNIIIMITC
jgi:hypothetical protein